MFSSISTLNSFGRNYSNAGASNYWQTSDSIPYVYLHPQSTSNINTSQLDTGNQLMYIGGSFSRIFPLNARFHSIYDINSSVFKITSKNYGTNGTVYAYAYDSSNNLLYCGGNFTQVTDNDQNITNVKNVAVWNISRKKWFPFGNSGGNNGTNGTCTAMALDASNNVVYVGGGFTTTSSRNGTDTSYNYVAAWNVNTQLWSRLGGSATYNGMDASCNALVYGNNKIYAGGFFRNVYDTVNIDLCSNYVAAFNISSNTWSLLGNTSVKNNGVNAACRALYYESSNNMLYAGGDFTIARDSRLFDISVNYAGQWNVKNSQWAGLGNYSRNGTNGTINSYAYDSSNNIVYCGGSFSQVYDSSNIILNANNAAIYNLNTSLWSVFGDNSMNGVNGICNVIAYDGSNSSVYVGGNFTSVRDNVNNVDLCANYIARWDTTQIKWNPVGTGGLSGNKQNGTNNQVSTMILDTSYQKLYVGGFFKTVSDSSNIDLSSNYISSWNLATQRWVQLGNTNANNGLDGSCNALALDSVNNVVYVGGNFVNTWDASYGDQSLNYIAKWNANSSVWESLGGSTIATNGTQGTVTALKYDSTNGQLFVGGKFTKVRDGRSVDISVNYIANWSVSKSQWSGMGGYASNGTNGIIYSYAYDSCKNVVYCGGRFTQVYDSSNVQLAANNIASWNVGGKYWAALGSGANNGTDASVNAMAMDTSNQILYVGGNFKNVFDGTFEDQSANFIAKWNAGSQVWSLFGSSRSGTSGAVNAVVYDSSNLALLVGGNFTRVRDRRNADLSANYIANWNTSTNTWSPVGNTITVPTSGANGVGGIVYAYAYDSCKNMMYVAGGFNSVYDGSNGTMSANNIAAWNNSTKNWSQIGSVNYNGTDGSCNALAIDLSNRLLYVGGFFRNVYDSSNLGQSANYVAALNINTQTWSMLGSSSSNGTDASCSSLVLDNSNQVLYVGGGFKNVYDSSFGNQSVNYIANWNVIQKSWSPLGTSSQNGLNNACAALVYDNSNSSVFAGGYFTTVSDSINNGLSAKYIANWSIRNNQWYQLGGTYNGTNANVYCMALDACNQQLYVGGAFTYVYDSATGSAGYTGNTGSPTLYFTWWNMKTSTWTQKYYNIDIVRSCAVDTSNSIVYIGGDFTYIGIECRHIAAINQKTQLSSKLSQYGDGGLDLNGSYAGANVFAFAFDSSYNLFTGGQFTSTGSNYTVTYTVLNNAGIWNPYKSSWSCVGLTIYYTYSAAVYTAVFSKTYNNGTNGQPYALAIDASNRNLYAGGAFTTVSDSSNNGQSANYIAQLNFNTQRWLPLGLTSTQNGTGAVVYALAMDVSNQQLFVGGNFTTVNDASSSSQASRYLANWNVNTSRWSGLGTYNSTSNGVNAQVNALLLDASNTALYVGGTFTQSIDSRGFNIASVGASVWNYSTSSWTPMGIDSSTNQGVNGYVTAFTVDTSKNIYAGGLFSVVRDDTMTTDLSANNTAFWSVPAQTWSIQGTNIRNGFNAQSNTMDYHAPTNMLYVGGNFTQVYDSCHNKLNVNYLVKWDASNSIWVPIGNTLSTQNGTNNIVNAITIDSKYGNVFVGGAFSQVYDNVLMLSNASGGAMFNIANNQWSLFGGGRTSTSNGLNNSVYSIYADPTNQMVYVGGGFTKASDFNSSDMSINNVAAYNLQTKRWSGMGWYGTNGTNGAINAYAYDSSKNVVYCGGSFSIVYDSSNIQMAANNIAVWNVAGKYWSLLGNTLNNGLDASCNALIMDSSNQILYVGGNFTNAFDATNLLVENANYVAAWNVSQQKWNRFGGKLTNGMNSYCTALEFDAASNRVFAGGNFTFVSDAVNYRQSANYIAYWSVNSQQWSPLGAVVNSNTTYKSGNIVYNGLSNICRSLKYSNGLLYVGGDFTLGRDLRLCDISLNSIAIWNTSTSQWSGLGGHSQNGTNGNILSYAYDSCKNVVYCGGNFSEVYDLSNIILLNTKNIAAWNINSQSWSRLGSFVDNGSDGSCNAMAMDSSNQVLYVGGSFLNVWDGTNGDTSANYIAKWNVGTQRWSTVATKDTSGNGLDGSCNAMVYDTSNSNVYVGGTFSYSNYKISGSSNVYSRNIAKYNVPSSLWSSFGGSTQSTNGVNAKVTALAYDASNSVVYVGGNFKLANDSRGFDISANSIAAWNETTSQWTNLGSMFTYNGTNGTVSAYAYDSCKNVVYCGGRFAYVYDSSNTAGLYANNIASWNISSKTWSQLGASGANNGTDASVNTLTMDTSNQILYVGGNFLNVWDGSFGDQSANYVAAWNAGKSTWSVLGTTANRKNGTDASVNALALDFSNQSLYVGGAFKNVRYSSLDQSANFIANWNIGLQTWSRLGGSTTASNGTGGFVNTLLYDASNTKLYVGGNFTTAKDLRSVDLNTNYIAIWDPSTNLWSGMGSILQNGTDGTVSCYAYDSCKNIVYCGGKFNYVYDSSNIQTQSNNIAAWSDSTQTWSQLGATGANNGTDASVNSLTMDTSNQILYVGGNFLNVWDGSFGDQSANYIAAWNVGKQSWSVFGTTTNRKNGTDASVNALALDFTNQSLYVGGAFKNVRYSSLDQSANFIAKWDIGLQTWSRLGGSTTATNGTAGFVNSLVYDASNTGLYVGGNFTSVKDSRYIDLSTNYIAIWNPSISQWSGMGSIIGNGTNGTVSCYAYDSCKNIVYCGGKFNNVYDTSNIQIQSNNIAAWNVSGQYWSQLGAVGTNNGTDASVNTLSIDTSNQILYVGGNFLNVWDGSFGDQSANYIAAWNVGKQSWSVLGTTTNRKNGTDASVNALALDFTNQSLYVGGAFKNVRYSALDQSANFIARWNIGLQTWSIVGGSSVLNGTTGFVNTLLYDASNTKLYVGGNFTSVKDSRSSGLFTNYIAIWDPSISQWSGMGPIIGNGIDGTVSCYVYDSCKNIVYCGGKFNYVYDSSNIQTESNNIAAWSVSTQTWSQLGAVGTNNGTDASVNTLSIDTSNQILYVGGNFLNVWDGSFGDQSANYVAAWNVGKQYWSVFGTTVNRKNGTDASVNALALDFTNQSLYVGGAFKNVRYSSLDQSANFIAKWDIGLQTWSRLGGSTTATNGTNGFINSLLYDSSNIKLYVGGYFTGVRDSSRSVDLSANHIAMWNPTTSQWSTFGSATQNGFSSYTATGLYFNIYDGYHSNSTTYDSTASLRSGYTSGYTTSLLTLTAGTNSQLIQYASTNSTFSIVWSGYFLSNYTGTYTFSISSDDVTYLWIGDNATTGYTTSNYLLGGNNTYFGTTGTYSMVSGVYYPIRILYGDWYGGYNIIFKWSTNGGSTYTSDGSANFFSSSVVVNTMALDSCNQLLYVGGNFTSVSDSSNNGQSAKYIAQWNLNTERWLPLGATTTQNGTNGLVNSITLDSRNNYVYAGGNFTTVSDVTTKDQSANNIVFWNQTTSRWSRLGSSSSHGTNNIVSAIVLDGSQNMYIGGNMTTVSDASSTSKSVKNAAFWTPSTATWSRLGPATQNGLNSYANTMALDSCNQLLYVGGNFTTVSDSSNNGQSAKYIAQWNLKTQNWLPLGATSTQNGTSGYINSIVLDSSNNYVYAGGNFITVSDATTKDQSANYIAFWNQTTSRWSILGSSSSYGTNNIVSAIILDGTRNMYIGGNMTTVSDASGSKSVKNAAFWTPSTASWSRLGSVIQNGIVNNNPYTSGLYFAGIYDGLFTTATYDSTASLRGGYIGGTTTTFSTLRDSVNNQGIGSYNTIVWNGYFLSSYTGTYTFSVNSDSAYAYVWIGDNATSGYTLSNYLIYTSYSGYYTGTYTMVSGVYYPIRIMYGSGGSVNTSFIVRWSTDGGSNYTTNGTGVFYNLSYDFSMNVTSMALDSCNQLLYVGGNFTAVSDSSNNGQSANYIAQWNLKTERWLPLGATSSQNGINRSKGSVNSIVLDSSNNYVYAGGDFTRVSDATTKDQSANCIAFWNQTTSTWSRLGSSSSYGTNNIVSAIILDRSQDLYIGGNMTTVSDASGSTKVKNAAYWMPSTATWSRLGVGAGILNGLNSYANTMALDSSNQLLYVGGNFTTVTDTSNSGQSANYIAQWNINTQNWLPLGATSTQNGTSGYINSVVLDSSNNFVYAAGNFTIVYDSSNTSQSANYLAYWNQTTSRWLPMGLTSTQNGTNSAPSAMVVDGSRNVYVGGKMTTVTDFAGSIRVKTAAIWSPSTASWSVLGTSSSFSGTDGSINALVFDSSNSILYAGGSFANVYNPTGGISAKYIASWDVKQSQWVRLGSSTYNGLDASCLSLIVDTSNSRLYAAGYFKNVYDSSFGGQTANRIAYWNQKTSTWSRIGSSASNGLTGTPFCMTMDASKNIYVGGTVATVSDSTKTLSSIKNAAYWSPVTTLWNPLGSILRNGTDGSVNSIVLDNSNQLVYIGGTFKNVKDISNTSLSSNYVSSWNISTQRWTPLGTANSAINGTNNNVNAMLLDASNRRLYVGGNFLDVYDSSFGDQSANRIAYWNQTTSTWSRMGTAASNGLDSSCNALAFDSVNNHLYVGGVFSNTRDSTGTKTANKTVIWNANTQTWLRFGNILQYNGTDASVNAVRLDPVNNVLYVGGNFSNVYDASNSIVKSFNISTWNATSKKWVPIGYSSSSRSDNYGATHSVRALMVDVCSNYVYLGGDFYGVSDNENPAIDASNIAHINLYTGKLYSLGVQGNNGTSGAVSSIAIDSNNGIVYVDGSFTNVYDSSNLSQVANYIAAWNTGNSTWSPLGDTSFNGLNGVGTAIVYDSVNNVVYAGGNFTNVMDKTSTTQLYNYVAKWNPSTSRWSPLGTYGNGTNGTINAYAYNSKTKVVYCGGYFSRVFDASNVQLTANNIAAWNITGNYWSLLGASGPNNGTDGSGCNVLVMDTSNQSLYVGGSFLNVWDSSNGDTSANYIAQWNIGNSTWSTVATSGYSGNGLDGSCNAMVYDTSNSNLYVGGTFNYSNYGGLNYYDASALVGFTFEPSTVYSTNVSTTVSNVIPGSSIGSATLVGNAVVDSSNVKVGTQVLNLTNNSTASYLQLPTLPSTLTPLTVGSGFSVSYWIYTYSSVIDTSTMQISDLASGSLINYFSISYASTTTIRINTTNSSTSNSGGIAQTIITTPTAQWYHILVTLSYTGSSGTSASAITTYINGGNYSTTSSTGYYPNTSTSYAYNYFGTSTTIRAGQTVGLYDEFYVYGNVLTATQAKLIYNKGISTGRYDSIYSRNVANFNVPSRLWTSFGGTNQYTNGVNNKVNALAYDASNSMVYLGGAFNSANDSTGIDLSTNYIVAWNENTSKWSYLGNSSKNTNGLDGSCNALIFDTSNSYLYVGGIFKNVWDISFGDQSANSVARWNVKNSTWTTLGGTSTKPNGVNGPVLSMALDSSNNQIYMSGNFTKLFDSTKSVDAQVGYLAEWNLNTNKLTSISNTYYDASNGTNGNILSYAFDSCKNIVYCGGFFTKVSDPSNGDLSANNIAAWNVSGQYWSQLGAVGPNNGTDASVNTLSIDTSNQILYVGGNFLNVWDGSFGDQSANYIAAWNAGKNVWSVFGTTTNRKNGTDASVNALALDSANQVLYVGGAFKNVRDSSFLDQSANFIAKWDIGLQTWSRLGGSTTATNGTTGFVNTLLYDASNTRLYVGGNFVSVRDSRSLDISTNYIAAWNPNTSRWLGMGIIGQNGTNGTVSCYAYDSCKNVVYCGGKFNIAYDTSNVELISNNIAAWNVNGQYWSELGAFGSNNGTDASVNTLTMDSSNQILYVGGNFLNVWDSSFGDQSANYIAAWNAGKSTWSVFGTTTNRKNGTDASVNALALDSSNQSLYVGGAFKNVRDSSFLDQSANFIAKWNIGLQTWSRVGGSTTATNGTGGFVNTLVYDSSNTRLYVGGNFTLSKDSRSLDLSTNYIAAWNTSTSQWSGMGSIGKDGTNGTVSCYAYDSCKNVVYCGGKFTYVYDSIAPILQANYIAAWNINGKYWSQLGASGANNGTDANVTSLTMDTSNQILYVGGNFLNVWDSSFGDQSANYIAAWNAGKSSWSVFGTTTNRKNGTDASVNALALDSSNQSLYVGGSFKNVRDSSFLDQSANFIAKWNVGLQTWSRLGGSTTATNGTTGFVYSSVYDASNTRLYVGGNFTTVSDSSNSGQPANYIAQWNLKTQNWLPLGATSTQNGLNTYPYTMALDSCNQLLYVGGNFTTVSDTSNSGQSANYIAQWNLKTERWLPLGATSTQNGTNAHINSIVLDSSNNYVYAGGNFTTVGDATTSSQTAYYIAFWNQTSSTWSRLGSSSSYGTNNIVSAIVLDGSRNMYIGGNMTTVSDAKTTSNSVNNAAFWTPSTSTWSRLGSVIQNGLNSYANTMALDSCNQLLYVGGNFTTVSDSSNNGLSAKYIAQWNLKTQSWLPLGATTTQNGTSGYINSITLDSSNNYVYAGGNFTTVGDATTSSQTANYIAFWNQTSSTWSRLGSSSSYGTNNIVSAIILDGSRNMYIGGKMTTVSDASSTSKSVKNAAFWTPSTATWSRLGSVIQNGLNAYASTIALDSLNQLLYVGGNFTTVSDSSNNGQNANYIAEWNLNKQSWLPLGLTTTQNGTNGIVYALSFDASNSVVYVGGNFTIAKSRTGYDVSTNYIASWDTKYQLWSPFGYAVGTVNNGVNGIVYAVTTTNTNQAYVGGKFTTAYDYKGTVSNTFNNAIWNIGSYRWTKTGGYKIPGLNSAANALILDPSFINLYAGGAFSTAVYGIDNSYNVSNAAILNTSTATWSAFGNFNQNGLNYYPSVFAMDTTNNMLYAGGNFTVAQDGTNSYFYSPYIVSYNTATNQWVQLDTPIWNGVNAQVLAMTIDTSQNVLYVSGNFTRTFDSSNGGFYSNYIASFNLTTRKWGQLGNTSSNGANATVRAVSYDSTNYRIYAGGDFRDVYDSSNLDLSTNYIASWSINTQRWSRLGSSAYNGVDGSVNSLQFDSSNNYLLTLGNFNNVNDSTTTTKYYYPDFASFHF